MTAGKNNGAKPFLMSYFNSYIHKISFEYLIVFYLPIARVECFYLFFEEEIQKNSKRLLPHCCISTLTCSQKMVVQNDWGVIHAQSFLTLLVLIILISSEGFRRWSRCTFLPKLATKEIRRVNKNLYIFKLTNKLGKIVRFVLFYQLHIKIQEMLRRSRIMKRFNIFYGGTKVKGTRDASFGRAEGQ